MDESLEASNWHVGLLIAALVSMGGLLILYMNMVMRK